MVKACIKIPPGLKVLCDVPHNNDNLTRVIGQSFIFGNGPSSFLLIPRGLCLPADNLPLTGFPKFKLCQHDYILTDCCTIIEILR